jgi:hypothetical protein
VDVILGAEYASRIVPQPILGSDGVSWIGEGADGASFSRGQEIGLGLHFIPSENVWTLMSERIFQMENEVVQFQLGEGCRPPIPTDHVSMSRSEFVTTVRSCATSQSDDFMPTASARREHVWRTAGPLGAPASTYRAAIYHEAPAELEGCGADLDCPSGTRCREGACE